MSVRFATSRLEETEQPVTASTSSHSNSDYRKATFLFIVLRWLIGWLLKALFKIEVRGLENLPSKGGYIFAGNHLSWIDPFLMLALAPAQPRLYFIAAREHMEATPWRKFMTCRVGGVITVERGQCAAHREIGPKVKAVLDGGGVLGIFPEGTVSETETGELLPFKRGVGYFAAHSGKPIVPVAFSGTKELWLRKRVVMTIGEPLPAQFGGRVVAEELTQQTAQHIQAMLLPPTPADPGQPQLFKNFFTNLFIKNGK